MKVDKEVMTLTNDDDDDDDDVVKSTRTPRFFLSLRQTINKFYEKVFKGERKIEAAPSVAIKIQ